MQIFFQKNNKNHRDLFQEIEQACDGLIYVSETDAPVLPFCGGRADATTGEMIQRQTGANGEERIEEIAFDDFFGRLAAVKDWYGEPERVKAKKFLDLQKLLEENLRQRKVFRMGKIRLEIFAVGIDKEGYLAGVTTRAVET